MVYQKRTYEAIQKKNREEIKLYNIEYYEEKRINSKIKITSGKKKIKLNNQRKESVNYKCGAELRRDCLKKHHKSNKHLRNSCPKD